jgi:hypothetical protein
MSSLNSNDTARQRTGTIGLRLPALLALCVAVHLGINAPAEIYASNLQMFAFSVVDLLQFTLPRAILVASLTMLFLVFLRGIVGLALVRITGWIIIYLVFGFQFKLYIDNSVLDGRIIDWSQYDLRMICEVLVFVAGLYVCLRIDDRYWKQLVLAAALFTLMNLGVTAFALWPIASAQFKSADPDLRPAPKNPLTGRSLAPLLPFFGTKPFNLPNMDLYSSEKNVIIILVDTLQSDLAEEMIEANDTAKAALNGFTFFRNSAGVYPYTGMSLPAFLSGEIYDPGTSLDAYLAKANEERLERKLADRGFDTSYLGIWSRGRYASGAEQQERVELHELLSVLLYRQLPMVAKPFYFEESEDFIGNNISGADLEKLASMDVQILDLLAQRIDPTATRPQFKYIHLWGAHQPSTLDRDCAVQPRGVDRERYLDQAYCLFTRIGHYLEELERKGVYDASQIFIVADHGTVNFSISADRGKAGAIPLEVQSSAHPTILFKDRGRRGPLAYNDDAVSLLDMRRTIFNGAGVEPRASRDLNSPAAAGPYVRDFYFYRSADEIFRDSVRLDHYRIGPNVRELEGWTRN